MNIFFSPTGTKTGQIVEDIMFSIQKEDSSKTLVQETLCHYTNSDLENLTFDVVDKKFNQFKSTISNDVLINGEVFVGGTGMSMFASEFIEKYPEHNYYFIKKMIETSSEISLLNTCQKLGISEVDVLKNANYKINKIFDNLTEKLLLEWKDDIFFSFKNSNNSTISVSTRLQYINIVFSTYTFAKK